MSSITVGVEKITKIFSINKPQGIKQTISSLRSKSIREQKLFALKDVTFQVSSGEVLGIIGRNGSGKTTLLRTIAGIYQPDRGSIRINGTLAPLLQIGTGFQPELNAIENILISGMFFGISRSEIKNKVNFVLEYAELEQFATTKLKHYSSGMRARLAFSTAIQMNPDILLVDEIFAVGDMAFKKKSFEKFLSFKNSGKTIIFTGHSLDAIAEISDRVLLIDDGQVVMLGDPKETIKKYKDMVFASKK